MRTWGWLFIVALAACATPRPAGADPFEAARPELLHACVTAAGVERAALQACVGSLARPCIQEDGPSTSSEVLCWSAEADLWRALITDASTRLNQRLSYRDPARLTRANEAWAAWLDAECEYWAWEEGGGTGEQVDRVHCAARASAERAISLLVAER